MADDTEKKRNSLARRNWDMENGSVTLRFNGLPEDQAVTLDIDKLPDAVRRMAALDGASRYLQGSYNKAKTPAEARNLAAAALTSMLAGDYDIGRTATGGNAFADLVEAINARRSDLGKPALDDDAKGRLLDAYQLAKAPTNWIDKANKIMDAAQEKAREQINGFVNDKIIGAHIKRLAAARAAEEAKDASDEAEIDLDI